jgi:hypothetical protein
MTQRFKRVGRGRALAVGGVAAVAVAIGCADVGTAPDTPASLELSPFGAPAVVIGDTLRNESGAVAPVVAVVRNSEGEIIADAPVTYLYVEANRDSALLVDPVRGLVIGRKAPTGVAQIAARAGGVLQVLRPMLVTVRPDSVQTRPITSTLVTAFPDTGRAAALRNSTVALAVSLSNRQTATEAPVNGWLVRFALIKPANATNDTTAAAYLVNDNGGASVLDTTDTGGNAGRKVRVRAALFPTAGTDTVVVRATVTYKGRPVPGSGVLIRGLVTRGTP